MTREQLHSWLLKKHWNGFSRNKNCKEKTDVIGNEMEGERLPQVTVELEEEKGRGRKKKHKKKKIGVRQKSWEEVGDPKGRDA